VTVTLVGAGPGDADLLTIRAARVIAEADVVVHDALVGDSVLGEGEGQSRKQAEQQAARRALGSLEKTGG